MVAGPCLARTRCFKPTRIGVTPCCSMSTSMATLARAWVPATRRAGMLLRKQPVAFNRSGLPEHRVMPAAILFYEYSRFLVTYCLVVIAGGCFHCQERDQLEHVVLHDVADGTGLFVEFSPARHAEALGHRNLHALDRVPIPDRFEKRVGEAGVEQILDRFLAEVVVDAEDGRFGEDGVQDLVEGLSRGEIASEGLLDDDARDWGSAALP